MIFSKNSKFQCIFMHLINLTSSNFLLRSRFHVSWWRWNIISKWEIEWICQNSRFSVGASSSSGIKNLIQGARIVRPVHGSQVKSKQVIWYWFMIWFGINHFQITQIEVEIYLLGICTTQVRPTRRQIKNLFTNSIVENVLFEHVTWLNVACHVFDLKK